MKNLQDLVLVAGHAAFKSTVSKAPSNPEADKWWVLQSFQIGEPPFYIEHIRRGIVHAANNPDALLIFSGGQTRQEAGEWSEAKTYHEIAKSSNWWIPDEMAATRDDVARRSSTEEFARDSFENLLFGICRFQQIVGSYPRILTMVSWAFKTFRFDLHRAAIRFPSPQFQFDGFNEPIDLKTALNGERLAIRSFMESPFGSNEDLSKKREKRNPFGQKHNYWHCQGMEEFFAFIDDVGNAEKIYAHQMPWENSTV